MDLEPAILGYYAGGHEQDRLIGGQSLELIRTRILLQRFLPPPPGRILDVGGASGVYAQWLAGQGYDVDLVDPLPLHIEQAAALGGFRAQLGDARRLEQDDDSYDATLLLGPLYHLTERDERIQALTEAGRVTRPGGVVVGAAISRYASTFDGFFRGFVDRPGFVPILRADLSTGQHRNPRGTHEFFTTAFFHSRDELAGEVLDSGLILDGVLPIEGPLHWIPDLDERLADLEQRELILQTLASIEHDPAMTGASAHLFAAARVR